MDLDKNSTTKQIREYYLNNPPDGMSKRAIQSMSDSDLLDMHHFMSEGTDDIFENAEQIMVLGDLWEDDNS